MSEQNFNDLSPAETELLALLSEECAEVIQIVGKILRHGYASTHPDNEDGPDNRDMLETELGHVQAAQKLLIEHCDIESDAVRRSARAKARRVETYLHHIRRLNE